MLAHYRNLLLAALTVTFSGCASMEIPTIAIGKAATFSKMVDETDRDWSEAAYYYDQHRHSLRNSKLAQGKLLPLALKADKWYVDSGFVSSLRMTPTDSWAFYKHSLAEAQRRIDSITHSSFFQDGAFGADQLPGISVLQKARTEKLKYFDDQAPQALLAFAQSETGNFIEKYPHPASPEWQAALSERVHAQLLEWTTLMAPQQSGKFLTNNLGWMTPDHRRKLQLAWSAQYAKASRWRAPLSLSQRLQAFQALNALGDASSTNAQPLGGLKLALVTQGSIGELSRLANSLGGSEEPWGNTLADTNASLAQKGYDLALYLKPNTPSGSVRVKSETAERARYQSGSRQTENPGFAETQIKLQRARAELEAIRSQHYQTQAQASQLAAAGGGYALIGALGSAGVEYGMTLAQKDIDRLQQELAAMPRTITQPSYADYHRLRVVHQIDVQLPVRMLLVDLATQQSYSFQDILQESQTVSSVLPSSIHPNDASPPPHQPIDWQTRANALTDRWKTLLVLSASTLLEAAKGRGATPRQFEQWYAQKSLPVTVPVVKDTRRAVAPASPQIESSTTPIAQTSTASKQSNNVLGSLLQAAGQVTQAASGSGQGYEAGLLMQGVGAALDGNDQSIHSVSQRAASYGNTSTNSASPALRNAETKHYSFSHGQCPMDLQGARKDISHPDIRASDEGFKQRVLDMARKTGGYDLAIAYNAAQREEYLRVARESAQTAAQTKGGSGNQLDIRECPAPDGIYCSAIHNMWSHSDMVIITNYTDAALRCHKSAGTAL